MEDRLQARKDVQDFFEIKRKAMKDVRDKFVRQRFLAEMNGIAGNLETKAMGLADAGKDWSGVVKEAQEEFEKLKTEFVKRLGGDDPVMRAPNEEAIQDLQRL